MNRKHLLTGLFVTVLAASSAFAAAKPAAKVLKEGSYSAKVAVIACNACVPEIEKTLKAELGIDEVSVNQKTSSVKFSVKPGAKVQLSELQAALKASSDKMGMGADYTLQNIKQVSKEKEIKGEANRE